jgi:hypothetical protein
VDYEDDQGHKEEQAVEEEEQQDQFRATTTPRAHRTLDGYVAVFSRKLLHHLVLREEATLIWSVDQNGSHFQKCSKRKIRKC